MSAEDRVGAIRLALGPPPADPAKRALHDLGTQIFAELPEAVAQTARLFAEADSELVTCLRCPIGYSAQCVIDKRLY